MLSRFFEEITKKHVKVFRAYAQYDLANYIEVVEKLNENLHIEHKTSTWNQDLNEVKIKLRPGIRCLFSFGQNSNDDKLVLGAICCHRGTFCAK